MKWDDVMSILTIFEKKKSDFWLNSGSTDKAFG